MLPTEASIARPKLTHRRLTAWATPRAFEAERAIGARDVAHAVKRVNPNRARSSRVAAAAIAQEQDRRGVGVAALADAVPVPAQAVAGELAGVVTQAEVEVAAVASQIVDAVRNDHARRPTGEVVVERPEGPLRPHAAVAVELSQMLLGLGVEGKHRVSRRAVLGLQLGDALELRVPVGRLPPPPRSSRFCATPVPLRPANPARRGD